MNADIAIEKKRFIKFALVGISGTVVDFGIFNLLSSWLGFATIPSSVVSFIAAVINNFHWNRQWTYPESKERPFSEQFGKFAVVSVAGLVIRTLIFSSIETPLIQASQPVASATGLSAEIIGHNLALAFVIIIVLFWNYFANKIWTYKGI